MNKFFILSFLSVLWVSHTQAKGLDEALVHAYENNPQILQARYDEKSSYQGIVQARSGFFPTLNLTASAYKSEREPDGASETVTHPRSASVDFEQNLFTGGQVFSTYRSSKNLHEASKSGAHVIIQGVLVSVAQAYTDVLRDREILTLQENQVKVLSTQLDATKSRFKQGEVTKTDVKQSEARVAAAKAKHIQARGVLATSVSFLKNVLGEVPQEMEWPLMEFAFPSEIEELKERVMETHPSVMASLAQLGSKKHLVGQARSGYLPSLVATASFSKNNDISGQNYEDKAFGVALSLPLFAGGNTVSKVRQAKVDKASAQEFYEQTRRDVEQEFVDAFQAYQTASASLNSFKEAEEAAGLAAKSIIKEAEVGERDVLDVLDTQQEHLEASVNVSSARRDVVVSAYRLKAAMGDLTQPPAQ